MTNSIENSQLKIAIDSFGAQLMEIKSASGTDYLWNGDPKYWSGRAPNLFPYVGRLTEHSYWLGGAKYSMDIHGFAPQSEFEVCKRSENAITYTLCDSEDTFKSYPLRFVFNIRYTLIGRTLFVRYEIENKDEKTMFFGLGGHPAFRAPLEHGLNFEDYYLEFDHVCAPSLVGMTDDCFVSGHDAVMPLEQGRIIRMKHSMFDNDAIILKNMATAITLKSDLSSKMITVRYPDMRYLGLWHMPRTDAPYICIEPWTSLSSRKGIVEDFSCQSDLIRLFPGVVYRNIWSVEIFE